MLKIIKGLRKKRLNMFGGNCGMFALALGRYIKDDDFYKAIVEISKQ